MSHVEAGSSGGQVVVRGTTAADPWIVSAPLFLSFSVAISSPFKINIRAEAFVGLRCRIQVSTRRVFEWYRAHVCRSEAFLAI